MSLSDLEVAKYYGLAIFANARSWLRSTLLGAPNLEIEDPLPDRRYVCVENSGGLERLTIRPLEFATAGYNVPGSKNSLIPKPANMSDLPQDCVLVRCAAASVNYADVCIRLGLYVSQQRYVGFPMCPGFDIAGKVEWVGSEAARSGGFAVGDRVYGFSFFGAFSSHVLVPASQIRKTPAYLNDEHAAALPGVCGTALHAAVCAGLYPVEAATLKGAGPVLVHSAAGGVGSTLLQLFSGPLKAAVTDVVAVVGSGQKAATCEKMGATTVVVRDRNVRASAEKWAKNCTEINERTKKGYTAIFDGNGVDTLQQGYNILRANGRLITFGFHSNLPRDAGALSPLSWLRMGLTMRKMPAFDAMDMSMNSKGIAGFNLSFFAEEHQLLTNYLEVVHGWIERKEIAPPPVVVLDIREVRRSHQLISSGMTKGKLVVTM